jgi:uncharacterized RDD family membrane protein YckC
MKMGYVEGKIIIGNNPCPVAAQLPPELRECVEDRRPWVRLGAVHELRNLLASSNKGLMLAAQAALTSLATEDDSQEVRKAAEQHWAAAGAGTGIRVEEPEAAGAAEAERQRAAKAEAERAEQALRGASAKAGRQRAERPEAEPAFHQIPALTYVHPMRRAGADLVDWIITLGVVMLIGQLKPPELVGSLALGAAFVYSIYIRKTGATPGHTLMGTRIVDFRGNPLRYPQSVAYVVLWLICSPTLIWGTALCVRFSSRHVAIYDLMAGTKAVPKKG